MQKSQKMSYSSVFQLFLFFALSAFLLVCLQSQAVFAQNSIEINADSQFDYANHCFENQDYQTAAAEYKKFIYFFPDDERVDIADFKTGMSYFHDKSYSVALNHFTRILDQQGPTETGISSAFMVSRCYQRVRNYAAAIQNLNYLKQVTSDADLTDKIIYHLGWLYLESGDFSRARSAFSDISIKNREKYHTTNIDEDLSKLPEIPEKSPVAAGILSIIPGGGYLYCGRYQDALTAFLINSALIYGAYESFDKELYAVGGMMAVLETGFYAGNIYGGVSSAHKFNQRKQNEFVQRVMKKFNPDIDVKQSPGLSMHFQPNDIRLMVSYSF